MVELETVTSDIVSLGFAKVPNSVKLSTIILNLEAENALLHVIPVPYISPSDIRG